MHSWPNLLLLLHFVLESATHIYSGKRLSQKPLVVTLAGQGNQVQPSPITTPETTSTISQQPVMTLARASVAELGTLRQ